MTTPAPPDILATLRRHIVEHFDVPPEGFDDDTPFTAMGLDSLGLVDFMFQVEDLYHVRIEHDEAMADPTLAGLARLVARLQQAQPGAALAKAA
jgi:acyl carrier protein